MLDLSVQLRNIEAFLKKKYTAVNTGIKLCKKIPDYGDWSRTILFKQARFFLLLHFTNWENTGHVNIYLKN